VHYISNYDINNICLKQSNIFATHSFQFMKKIAHEQMTFNK